MYILAPMNESGGEGKTTTALTIATGMAIQGKRVALIDADPNAKLTPSLGYKKRGCLYDLLVRDTEWSDLLIEVDPARYAPASGSKGALLLLPGNSETGNIASSISNPHLFGARLRELAGVVDLVIVDTSPTANMLHGSVYMAADGVIYTAQPAYLSLGGLHETLKHTGQANTQRQADELAELKIIGIQPTFYRNIRVHDEFIRKYRSLYGRQIVWPAIPQAAVWLEASAAQRSIFAYVKQEMDPASIDADYDPTEDEERSTLKIAWALVRRAERSMAEHV